MVFSFVCYQYKRCTQFLIEGLVVQFRKPHQLLVLGWRQSIKNVVNRINRLAFIVYFVVAVWRRGSARTTYFSK